MPHEIDPLALTQRNSTENHAVREQDLYPPTESMELQELLRGAEAIYSAHTNNVILKIEALLKKYKSFEKFPPKDIKDIAYFFGDQELMVKALAMVITQHQGQKE